MPDHGNAHDHGHYRVDRLGLLVGLSATRAPGGGSERHGIIVTILIGIVGTPMTGSRRAGRVAPRSPGRLG